MNEIAATRSRLMGSGSVADKAEANAELIVPCRALVVVETTPTLKRMPTSGICRMSWQEPRTVSQWRARITTMRCRF